MVEAVFRSISAKIDALQVKNLHSKPSEDKSTGTQVLGAECTDDTENCLLHYCIFINVQYLNVAACGD